MIDEARTRLEEVCRLPEREWFDQLNIRRSEQSEEELRQEAEEELDYTDRFLNRLLGMTLNTPEYEYIVFLGP